jgi:hypothetical protein
MDATIVTQVVTNVLLCLLLGWKRWKRNRDLAQSELKHKAERAVRHVQSSYTRPIVMGRLQQLLNDNPRSFRQSGDALGCARGATRLTPEEKQSATKRAVTHMFEMGTSGDEADMEMLIKDAYHRLPPLLTNTITEATCMLQLLSSQDAYIPNTPFSDDFV